VVSILINSSLLCRTTYAKVAGKYQDVLTLEQSVAELHQMFLDFALLTEQQGELLDQIEFQVKQAGDYVNIKSPSERSNGTSPQGFFLTRLIVAV
jgi:t-SNARE complex subunit (syntaxin)